MPDPLARVCLFLAFISDHSLFAAINMCAADNGGCGPTGSCNFTGPGIRSCHCHAGYTLVNDTCVACECLSHNCDPRPSPKPQPRRQQVQSVRLWAVHWDALVLLQLFWSCSGYGARTESCGHCKSHTPATLHLTVSTCKCGV